MRLAVVLFTTLLKYAKHIDYIERYQQKLLPAWQQQQLSNNGSRTTMGKLTLTVFLALCPAVGNAFVVRALGSTPVDSPQKRQASASLGAPLGIGRRLGADGALSRAGCNDAEDYAAWCSRRNRPLHGSKGVEVRAYTFKRCLPRPHLGRRNHCYQTKPWTK